MTSAIHPPHHIPASQGDLFAFATYWSWERRIAEMLPRVISRRQVAIVYQPIYDLEAPLPEVWGFEALARFPVAPRIPVGLWFRVAEDLGRAQDLDLVILAAANEGLAQLSSRARLCVNACLETAAGLIDITPATMLYRLIVDLPPAAVRDPGCSRVMTSLRDQGVAVAFDDISVDMLDRLKPDLLRLDPDLVKIDLVDGLAPDPLGQLALSEAARWCNDAGIRLVAERVQNPDDLEVLRDLGIGLAQGYSLSAPTDLQG